MQATNYGTGKATVLPLSFIVPSKNNNQEFKWHWIKSTKLLSTYCHTNYEYLWIKTITG